MVPEDITSALRDVGGKHMDVLWAESIHKFVENHKDMYPQVAFQG